MRWFKHMTDSHSDEKLCDIISESGPEAYGMWWLVLEIVAKQMDKNDVKCSVEYSETGGKYATLQSFL